MARWLACVDAAGNPPTASTNCSLDQSRACAIVEPRTSSVSADPHAIELTHPFARKRISVNAVAGKLQRQLQHIAASRILNLHFRIRVGNHAGVARMLEVIENLGRVHPSHLSR